jgi:flagellar protein FlbD
MIAVTRMDGVRIVLNAERIESLESVPETLIRLVDRRPLLVRESLEEIVTAFKEYKRAIAAPLLGAAP